MMEKNGKTLGEQWGIVPWLTIRIDEQPAWLKDLVLPHCDDNKFGRQGVCDLAFVAPTSAAVMKQKARRLKPAIDPDGTIWVVYPKAEFNEKYNFDSTIEEIVSSIESMGLKTVKTVAVNDELLSISVRVA